MKGIQNLRVDYSGEIVDLKSFNKDPINEFKSWFEFAKNNEVIEPNAMVLSTLNNNSINSRTVLLKDISSDGFTFFTNYTSKKGVDIQKNNIDYVVCFGGYISLPVGLSAWICRKPLFLHEQNAIMGTSNKMLKKFSKIRI